MPIFRTEYYKPEQNLTGYRTALHLALADCKSPDERETILRQEAIEMTRHVTDGIRDLIKHEKRIRHLVLDLGAIPLATWSEAMDSLANGSLLALKHKVDEMRRDLEQGRVEGFTGTMFMYGKPTFATLEGFYDIVFEEI
jgi:hypothetical protein